jgi:hypothetical protein
VHTESSRGWAVAIYEDDVVEQMPEAAVLASLRCGNPTAVADLHEAEIVLDRGSDGRLDVILTAQHVGDSSILAADDLSEEEAGNAPPSRAGLTPATS